MDSLYDFILKHWPFFVAAIILGFIGEGMKRAFTKEAAKKSQAVWWFRATMPAHPVIAGAIAGATGQLPITIDSLGANGGILYYGLAGVVSSYVYAAFQNFVEKRQLEGAPESLKKIDVANIVGATKKEAEEKAKEDRSDA